MTIEKRWNTAYYMQLKEDIKERISSGEYAAGQRIPSERQLCDLFAVSRTTVRKAIDELVVDGVLIRRSGKGTYVCQSSPKNQERTGNILFVRCIHSPADDSSHIKDDIFYPKILTGLEMAASEKGYHCMVKTINENNFNAQIFEQISSSVDGIVCGEIHNAEFLECLQNTGLPVVLVSPSLTAPDTDVVEIDNLAGAARAVNHLLEHGHQRVAYIGGSPRSIPARVRSQGYFQVLGEADIPIDKSLSLFSGWRFEDGYNAAIELMKENPRPTAIFAASDVLAIGAISALRELGMQIPEDVSVVGFDDIDMAKEIKPSLTTIRVDKLTIGRVAADLLFQRISGGRDYHLKVVVPTTLIERDTVSEQKRQDTSSRVS